MPEPTSDSNDLSAAFTADFAKAEQIHEFIIESYKNPKPQTKAEAVDNVPRHDEAEQQEASTEDESPGDVPRHDEAEQQEVSTEDESPGDVHRPDEAAPSLDSTSKKKEGDVTSIEEILQKIQKGEYKEGEHYFVDKYVRKDKDGKVVSTSRTVRLVKEASAEDKDGNKITTGIKRLKHPYLFIDGIGYQRVEKELGSGGFGVVAEAFDQTGKKVAIKQSHDSVEQNAYEAEIEPAKQMGMLKQSAMIRENRTLMVMPLIEGFELNRVGVSEATLPTQISG
jgi:hypothetical protein